MSIFAKACGTNPKLSTIDIIHAAHTIASPLDYVMVNDWLSYHYAVFNKINMETLLPADATMPDDTIEDIAARYYVYSDRSEWFSDDVIFLLTNMYKFNDTQAWTASIPESLSYQSDIIWC